MVRTRVLELVDVDGNRRGWLSTDGRKNPVLALFDAPWLPIFLALIWLFHPLLGAVALGGAVVMLAIAALNERFTRRTLERAQEEGRRAGRFVEASLRNAEAVSALGMHGAVTRRWSLQGGYAFQNGEITESLSATVLAGARLAQVPRHSFSLWNRYDFTNRVGADHVTVLFR